MYEHQETGRSVRVDADADGAPAFAATAFAATGCQGGPTPCARLSAPGRKPVVKCRHLPYSGLTPHYEKRNNITETAPVPEHPTGRHQASGQTTGRTWRTHRCSSAVFIED